jgi:antitoxin component YwqK of YwqJK toxin-antitoxin module
MEEYTIPKNWEDLVGSFFDPNNKAARHLLEYASDPIIVQILLNIPHDKLETFCSINNRVRRICKSKLVKEQYYERNPILKTKSFEEAREFLKKNPTGLLHIERGSDFEREDLIELKDNLQYLELYDSLRPQHPYLSKNIRTIKFYDGPGFIKEGHYKDGELNGAYKRWYSNGSLESETNFKDGEPDGTSKEWYEDGKLKKVYHYKDGKIDGVYKSWYEDGNPKTEAHYKDDEKDGLYRKWDEYGDLVAELHYKDGEVL